MSDRGAERHITTVVESVKTPAFVYDEAALYRASANLARVAGSVGCRALFALKSFAVPKALAAMAAHLDGFAVSSLHEARLARAAAGRRGRLYLSTPGLRPDEVGALAGLCDSVIFNSLSQLERFSEEAAGKARIGLRVNPQLSFLDDERFDPCRDNSKLGVPLDQLVSLLAETPGRLEAVTGLQVHNNCDSRDFTALLRTVEHLADALAPLLERVAWINLGGGYLFPEGETPAAFARAVALLRERFGLEVWVEPGASLVRPAGTIVASVIDLFSSGGKAVAVLDTSVNHMPEVFEYQYEPDVIGDTECGRYEYVLAGCTCLAGDSFGLYGFDQALQLGSRLVFTDMGAYTLVKAHRFNGVDLPTVYALTVDGRLEPAQGSGATPVPRQEEDASRAVI